MKPRPQFSCRAQIRRQRTHGFSLVELAVTLAIASIVLVVLGTLASYGLQSFLVMGNCVALDDKSRIAADQITRELRQATRVSRYYVEPESKILVLTNSLQGYSIKYVWSAEARTLTCESTDQPPSVCLEDCDAWDATFFQNIPQPSVSDPYLAATNQFGILDLNRAQIVSMTWKCSRPVVVSKAKTESAQSIRVALRNVAQP